MALFPRAKPVSIVQNKQVELTLAEYVRLYFIMPSLDKYGPFTFKGRPYWVEPYESSSLGLLFLAGRQTAKSTALGNRLLALSCLRLNFMSLYVSPTETQTKQFSNDRIAVPVRLSKFLKNYTATTLKNDVFHRSFTTGSEIRLRYSYHNADRIRGIQTNLLCIDEVQDIIADNIPVIEQTLFTSAEKYRLYAGTPKSEANTLSVLWYESTMNEWLVPCHRHAFVVWNRCDESNVPHHPSIGLMCRKCHKGVNPCDPMAHWASMNPNSKSLVTMDGYRFPQLIAPDVDWADMCHSHKTYPRKQFFNERLGLPCEDASRPITREQLMAHCDDRATIRESSNVQRDTSWAISNIHAMQSPVWMGVDWGSGENSYTYVTIGSYVGGTQMRVLYFERLVGDLTDPDAQIDHLVNLFHKFKVTRVGTDYGGGFDRNIKMVQNIGIERLCKYQYANAKNKLYYDPKLGRFIVHRTELMTALFELLKRGKFILPRWEECEGKGNLGEEILAIHTESDKNGTMYYSRSPKQTDDGFHSLLYMTLASLLDRPMIDLIVPGINQHDPDLNDTYDVSGDGGSYYRS